jgi:hypothetical protein
MEYDRLQSMVTEAGVYRPVAAAAVAPRVLSFLIVTALLSGGACAATAAPAGAARPSASQDQAGVVLEGHWEVLVEDSTSGSRTTYFLILDDRRVSLRFAARPPDFPTSTRVRIRGVYEADGAFLVSGVERLSER